MSLHIITYSLSYGVQRSGEHGEKERKGQLHISVQRKRKCFATTMSRVAGCGRELKPKFKCAKIRCRMDDVGKRASKPAGLEEIPSMPHNALHSGVELECGTTLPKLYSHSP